MKNDTIRAGLGRALAVGIALCLTASVAAAGATSKQDRLARELIDVSGAASGQLREGLLVGLRQSMPDESPEFHDAIANALDIDEMAEIMARVYARHLKAKDMKAAIKFYRSPAGVNMVAKLVVVLEEQIEAADVASIDELWDLMKEDVDADQLQVEIERMFRGHLSPEDVRATVGFFRSRSGGRLVEKMPTILEESMAEMQPWLQSFFQGFMEKLPEMDIDTPVVHRFKMGDTLAEIRRVGNAVMMWMTDQVGLADQSWTDRLAEQRPSWSFKAAGSSEQVTYFVVPYETLRDLLVPDYIEALPEHDRWGHPYEFALNDNVLRANVAAIRSAGRDGRFDEGYTAGAYDIVDWDQDIVWADGYFVRFPQAPESEQ